TLDAASRPRLLHAPKPTKIRLRLPTVDISLQAELTPALNQLGLRTMFTNEAELTGMSPDELAAQAVLHDSVLKVDEQGLDGPAPEPATVTAHHLKLLMASGRHELAVQKASKALPVNVRELAEYRVAQRLGCSWCVDFGTMLQRMAGLDIERLRQIEKYATS